LQADLSMTRCSLKLLAGRTLLVEAGQRERIAADRQERGTLFTLLAPVPHAKDNDFVHFGEKSVPNGYRLSVRKVLPIRADRAQPTGARARDISRAHGSQWPQRHVGQRLDFDPSGNPAAARDRPPLPSKRLSSQFSRAWRGTLLRRSPGLHPGLNLIPRHAFTIALERSKSAGVFGQHVRRPRTRAGVAHGFERRRKRFVSGCKISHLPDLSRFSNQPEQSPHSRL
jgi:hypothetical protein